MEIKLKHVYSDSVGIQIESITVKDKVIIYPYKGVEYLVVGKHKQMSPADYKILRSIFKDELIYTKQQVLAPRKFFFI